MRCIIFISLVCIPVVTCKKESKEVRESMPKTKAIPVKYLGCYVVSGAFLSAKKVGYNNKLVSCFLSIASSFNAETPLSLDRLYPL